MVTPWPTLIEHFIYFDPSPGFLISTSYLNVQLSARNQLVILALHFAGRNLASQTYLLRTVGFLPMLPQEVEAMEKVP